jgi:hypothetical protein
MKHVGKTIILAAALVAGSTAVANTPKKKHDLPESKKGNLVVGMCDGETAIEVEGKKEGDTLTRDEAMKLSSDLMEAWKKKNPGARWDEGVRVAQSGSTGAKQVPPAKQQNVQSGHTYGAFSARDEAIWRASTEKFVEEGNKIFHDAKLLGGTIAVSCDMCHPNAANTHPETYPKYQVQLGRVALLRDMINWCIENPVRGKPLADDDVKLRAMEAYIYAQRKGTKLEYGKH